MKDHILIIIAIKPSEITYETTGLGHMSPHVRGDTQGWYSAIESHVWEDTNLR
jgi:hypothetical protein